MYSTNLGLHSNVVLISEKYHGRVDQYKPVFFQDRLYLKVRWSPTSDQVVHDFMFLWRFFFCFVFA